MTFQEKLKSLKKRIEGNMPAEYVEIIQNATSELYAMNITEKVIKVGNKIPGFELPDQNNEIVKSTDLYKDSF